MMEITYLIANYNNGRYLTACIDSLHQQTSLNWRCLIADDRSTDDSLNFIAPLLNDRIRLFQNETNVGVSQTRRNLMPHIESEIVGILDPDDALYPEATDSILRAYARNPKVGFVYTNYALFDAELQRLTEKGRSCPFKNTSLTNGFVGPLRTFRQSTYLKTDGWDPTLRSAEDRDLIYKMEEVTEFYFLNQILYKYRQLPTSQTHDPIKGRAGYRNHVQVCHEVMKRRRVQGLEALQYKLAISARIPHDANPILRAPVLARPILETVLKVCVALLGRVL